MSLFRPALILSILLAQGIRADQIEQTLDLDQPFQQGETLLWSPGFQKCWDEMLSFYKLKSAPFNPPNKLAKALNTFPWEYEKTVPGKSHFVVLAGTGEEYRIKTNELLRDYFGNQVAPFPRGSFGRTMIQGLTLISILNHHLTFSATLQESPRSLPFQIDLNGKKSLTPVKSFGATGAHRVKIEGQINILAYNEKQNRKALILGGKGPDEQLLLILDPTLKTPRQVITLANAWLKTQEQNKHHPRYVNHRSDTIEIPEIMCSDYADFSKHFPGEIQVNPATHISIQKAGQLTQLKMNHEGTKMVTKSYVVAPTYLQSSLPSPANAPVQAARNRNFVFDEPFFLLLRKKTAVYPFLFARIDRQALVPFH